jgi:hypothetical protein
LLDLYTKLRGATCLTHVGREGVYSGTSNTDADWVRCIESLALTDERAVSMGVPLACILVADAETPRPPAVWRKRMAVGQESIRSPEFYFAFVAPNAFIRGVYTAINWMTKSGPPGHKSIAVPTFANAATWVRKNAAKAYPTLEALYDEARSRTASAGRLVVEKRSAS